MLRAHRAEVHSRSNTRAMVQVFVSRSLRLICPLQAADLGFHGGVAAHSDYFSPGKIIRFWPRITRAHTKKAESYIAWIIVSPANYLASLILCNTISAANYKWRGNGRHSGDPPSRSARSSGDSSRTRGQARSHAGGGPVQCPQPGIGLALVAVQAARAVRARLVADSAAGLGAPRGTGGPAGAAGITLPCPVDGQRSVYGARAGLTGRRRLPSARRTYRDQES